MKDRYIVLWGHLMGGPNQVWEFKRSHWSNFWAELWGMNESWSGREFPGGMQYKSLLLERTGCPGTSGGQKTRRDGSEMRLEDRSHAMWTSQVTLRTLILHSEQQETTDLFPADWDTKRYCHQFCVVKKSLSLKCRALEDGSKRE